MNKELQKQIVDQFLHVIVSIILVNLIDIVFPLVLAALLVMSGWIVREIEQWPSKRWYDPPLDWFFQALGIVVGIGIAL